MHQELLSVNNNSKNLEKILKTKLKPQPNPNFILGVEQTEYAFVSNPTEEHPKCF